MILGMTTLTFVHVVISLVGILSGLVVLFGLIAGKGLDGWTALFLVTTVATNLTGYMFPFHKLLPSHVVGGISLVVLAIAILARYSRHLAGGWRRTYVISAVRSEEHTSELQSHSDLVCRLLLGKKNTYHYGTIMNPPLRAIPQRNAEAREH